MLLRSKRITETGRSSPIDMGNSVFKEFASTIKETSGGIVDPHQTRYY